MRISNRLISRLRDVDWDFTGNRSESPFSALHWHPARFVSQLPATVIGLLSRPGDLVLDPFSGSGTTLVEAQRLRRISIGIDLNPIACLIAKAKTIPVPARTIQIIVDEIKAEAMLRLSAITRGSSFSSNIPTAVQQKWYTRQVRDDLGSLWELIQPWESATGEIARAAFSALLLPVCRETRHWGYVCDNSTPKGNHAKNVLEEYLIVLDRFSLGYLERDSDRIEHLGSVGPIEKAEVLCGDVGEILATLPEKSVKLVVTSPPYAGVSDYIKSQRLSMEWFGLDIERLRLREIGARSKRHRMSALEDYLSQLHNTFAKVKQRLRSDGLCVVVIGESAARDSAVSQVISEITSCGLNKELDLNRTVSSQRRQAPSIFGEHLLVFSK